MNSNDAQEPGASDTVASGNPDSAPATPPAPAWRPLTARQRRVLGTLMEKSKTTPDAYPMTFLALTTGCNQKSNRDPINNYAQDQVEESVDQLRDFGAVALVQGNGRVPKVRHYGYQWLGITKVESAVMTELLLRGHQTIGELRTRASRMEPIADLATLQKILHDLKARNLVIYLSPEGRGQIVSHNLYQDSELAQLKLTANHLASQQEPELAPPVTASYGSQSASTSVRESQPSPAPTMVASHGGKTASPLVESIEQLQATVADLQRRLAYLEEQLGVSSESNAS